ncbi:unnamed protein product [Cunninghamella blakesleeana]
MNMGCSAAVSLSDNTYILYGGAATLFSNDPNLTYPFLHYNPQSDSWDTLPLLPNNTYSTRTQLVNLGDDLLWVWGGSLNSTGYAYTYDYGIFNYKTSSWINMQINTGHIRMDHTATLSSNGLIYIMGGFYKSNETEPFYLTDFSKISTYNTKTLAWGNIVAAGQIPTSRGLHSTVPSHDGNSFYIYGGAQILSTGLDVANDVFYIYNCYSNSFKPVSLPKNPLSNNDNNNRFGHFATLYNSTYLVLLFGYNDASTPAESLSILNITDPTNPAWVIGILGILEDYEGNGGGTDPKILISAIVVPIVIVLLAVGIGTFLYSRQRKRERQNAFVLEREDPRKRNANPLDFRDKTTENATTEANTNSLCGRSVDTTKPFMMEHKNHHPTNTVDNYSNSNRHFTISTPLQQYSNIERNEFTDGVPIKPFAHDA